MEIPNFNLSAKTLKGVNHLCIQLLLVKNVRHENNSNRLFIKQKKITNKLHTNGPQFIPKLFRLIVEKF